MFTDLLIVNSKPIGSPFHQEFPEQGSSFLRTVHLVIILLRHVRYNKVAESFTCNANILKLGRVFLSIFPLWNVCKILTTCRSTRVKISPACTMPKVAGHLAFLAAVCNLFLSYLMKINKQDGRIAPAYFSPNYKYFDQLLQTVKNKNYYFQFSIQRVFTNIISTTDFCTLYKSVSRFSVKIFCRTVPKKFLGQPFSVSLISGIEKC